MSVIVRLQNLPWLANAGDIRTYFHGLSIPEGGVHIVGGELGDVFIAFSTDEDARQAMLRDGGKIKEIKIKLYLSSRTEMQKIIDQARHQGMAAAMQQQYVIPNMPQQITQNMGQHITPNIGQHMAQNMSQPMPQNLTQNISANLGQNLSNMTHQLPMPNMGISNTVPLGSIPNISGMQVPLQNVQPIAAMVSKPEEQPIVPPAPPVGVLQLQTESQPIQSVNSELEKEKRDRKDRRRRSRSRSRGNSGSKSRSRSVSRSRSRSKDRKGRDRDRYYDRRRRRSRSRDRRRRRDRSRSYERSSRDKRRNDYRKEESEENPSTRWSNNQQSRNQTSKGKSNDTYNNRSQSFKDIYSDQKGGGSNMKRQFPPNSNNQNNNSNNSANVPRQSSSSSFKEEKPNSSLNKNNSLSDTAKSLNSEPKPEVSDNNNAQNQNPFVPFPTSYPPFNPQNIVSYPSYNQNIMGNNGELNRQQNSQEIQESKSNQEKQNLEKPSNDSSQRNFNLPSNNQQNQNFNHFKPFNNSEIKPNIFNNEPFMPPNNIGFNWAAGFPMGGNIGFPFPNQQANLNNDQQIKSNTAPSEKIPNTCVQIKNVPMNTSYEQVKEFFRQSVISNDCLKIIRTNNGMFIYVRFKSLHDKKQAILRSGCLLNNSIASVLHVDDNVFENAIDPMHSTMYGYQSDPWNKPKPVAMESGTSNLESEKKTIPELEMQTNNAKIYNCIQIEGTARNHPFFTNNHRIYPHIYNLCEKFEPVDLCVKKTNGKYVFGYIMFDAKVDIENVIRSLTNAKIEGKQVAITKCTEDEFNSNSEDNMPLDKNKFLSFISKPESKTKNDSGSKRQTKNSRFSDNTDEISENSRNEMETVKQQESSVSRNKVLLPTPDLQPIQEVDILPPTNCVLIQNLPFEIDQTIIVEFFSNINIVPAQIHIMLDPNGKPIGEAYCEFENYEEATSATNKNNCMLGDSQVIVNLVSREEMMKACSVNVSPQNTNTFPNQDYFNGPPAPPSLFNMRLEQPPNWNIPYNPSGPPEPLNPPDQMGSYDDEYDMGDDDDSSGYGYNNRGNSRGVYRGGRGNNFDRGGRGYNRGGGRGRDHSGFNRDNDNFDRGFGNFRGRGGRGGSDQEGRMSDRGGRGRGGFERGRGGGGGFERGGGFDRGGGGFERGGGFDRGGKGFDRGGKGFERGGRGFDRGGRGFDRGERGSFTRGGIRGRGRDMNEGFDRPRSLMSIGQDLRGSPSQMPIQDESVLEFGQPGCVIAAENIPYRADINDILDFFADFKLTPECVIRRYDDHGKVTGDARISFENPSEARRAVKSLDNKYIGNRKVSLSFFN